MTGWWLTTELYDDNTESLMVVHLYHLAFKRPEIMKFLALPNGFRFYKEPTDYKVWFDPDALEE